MSNNIGKFCIVRTYSAGVHAGTVKTEDGKHIVLENARRIWFWRGAFTLSTIALNGVGEGSKLPAAVPEITLTEAIEIIPCTQAAQDNITNFPVHKE